ncbi:MAG: FkbM family methyltransferase [Candidatus Omnitrophota bacterium]
MIKKLRKKFLRSFRKLLGTEQISQQQYRQEQLQHQQEELRQQLQLLQLQLLLSLGNSLKYSSVDQKKIKESITYKRCAELVSLFAPMNIEGAKYVRVGGNHDGGYVMLDGFRDGLVEAAYSFGIGDNVSWDEAIACRGINVFMYDHTIQRLPKNHPNFHYFKTGITGYEKGVGLKTLSELVANNNHTACKNLILKMDIEGYEWDVFREIPSSVISQFSQFVVEFHDLRSAIYGSGYDMVAEVLKKINQTHQSVHVHANSFSAPLWIGEFVLPTVIEVTFVRRADFKDKFIANTRQFPTEIDQSSCADLFDIYLNGFYDCSRTAEK